MSLQCQQLNRLFSQCVDGNRIRIPENLKELTKLEDPPKPKTAAGPFILDTLHAASTDFVRENADIRPKSGDETDIMDLFLARDQIAMSKSDLLQLVLKWYQLRNIDVLGYSQLLNFSALIASHLRC